MRLSDYDDMMGLEFGDYEDLGALITPAMIKEALIASTAGGGAILGTVYLTKLASEKLKLAEMIPDPLVRSAVVSAVTFFGGLLAGRGLYEYNREAAMGVVGGLGGIAMANLLDAVIAKVTGSARMTTALGDLELTQYGEDDGMEALAALETTSIQSAPGAFQRGGLSDPTVTPEALMGLDAAIVQQETLGGYNAYMS